MTTISERHFDIGNQVWYRVPGLCYKLEESWIGPFVIKKRLHSVNYKMQEGKYKGKLKVLNVNNLK